MVCSSGGTKNKEPLKTMEAAAFDKQGHRGARGLMPENTIPAMLKALELGVTTLEMDVHISKDGKVVLSHDPYMKPAYMLLPDGTEIPQTDQKKWVLYELEYKSIRAFDAGSKRNARFPDQQSIRTYKPLLSEVMDAVQAYLVEKALPQVYYNIEIKTSPEGDGSLHPAPAAFVERVMKVVQEKQLLPWVIFQSFDVRTLQVLHKRYSAVKNALLVENKAGVEENLKKLGFTPDIYSPDYTQVDRELVQKSHALGMRVIPWTVNTLEEMRSLQQMGVDGIISDYPTLFAKL